ncbi:MAG: hypothetical protein WC406_07495 [Methanoregula sp.]
MHRFKAWEMDKFLRHARFYFTDEVIQELRDAGVSRVKAAAQEHGFCIPAGKKKIPRIP